MWNFEFGAKWIDTVSDVWVFSIIWFGLDGLDERCAAAHELELKGLGG